MVLKIYSIVNLHLSFQKSSVKKIQRIVPFVHNLLEKKIRLFYRKKNKGKHKTSNLKSLFKKLVLFLKIQ